MVTACFNNDLSEDQFNEKRLAGDYYGTYTNETDNIETEFHLTLTDEREFQTSFGNSNVTIDKDLKVSGRLEYMGDMYTFEGTFVINDLITASGTWEGGDDQGVWQMEKMIYRSGDEEGPINEEISYNHINEELTEIAATQVDLLKQYDAIIPGGSLQEFNTKNENVMGTPSETIVSYRIHVNTATSIEDATVWLYEEAKRLDWYAHEDFQFDDEYGSFNIHFLREDGGPRQMLVQGTAINNYSQIYVTVDNR